MKRFTFWLSLIRACLRREMHHAPSSVLLVLATTYIEVYGTEEQRYGRKLPNVTRRTVSFETILKALGPMPSSGGGALVPPEHIEAVRAFFEQDALRHRTARLLGDVEPPYEETHDC